MREKESILDRLRLREAPPPPPPNQAHRKPYVSCAIQMPCDVICT